ERPGGSGSLHVECLGVGCEVASRRTVIVQPLESEIRQQKRSATVAYYRDFREFLDTLDRAGKLRRIADPIDKDRELHPLVRWQYRGLSQDDRTGFLFEHVT